MRHGGQFDRTGEHDRFDRGLGEIRQPLRRQTGVEIFQTFDTDDEDRLGIFDIRAADTLRDHALRHQTDGLHRPDAGEHAAVGRAFCPAPYFIGVPAVAAYLDEFTDRRADIVFAGQTIRMFGIERVHRFEGVAHGSLLPTDIAEDIDGRTADDQ